MISEKLVKLSKKKEWWFEDVETTYSIALESLGLDLNSDISVFFLHIEDGPNFYSGKLELY